MNSTCLNAQARQVLYAAGIFQLRSVRRDNFSGSGRQLSFARNRQANQRAFILRGIESALAIVRITRAFDIHHAQAVIRRHHHRRREPSGRQRSRYLPSRAIVFQERDRVDAAARRVDCPAIGRDATATGWLPMKPSG